MNKLLHTLFRAPGKSSRALLWAVLAGLVLSPFYAGAAYAASLTVAIKQVKPDSAVQTVTCVLLKPGCVLPFVINAGQPTAQSVNINVVYYAGGLALNFQAPKGYFYTGTTVGNIVIYNTLWNRPLQGSTPATYTVTLFQPLASRLMVATSIEPTATPSTDHTSVANLEITATSVP